MPKKWGILFLKNAKMSEVKNIENWVSDLVIGRMNCAGIGTKSGMESGVTMGLLRISIAEK